MFPGLWPLSNVRFWRKADMGLKTTPRLRAGLFYLWRKFLLALVIGQQNFPHALMVGA